MRRNARLQCWVFDNNQTWCAKLKIDLGKKLFSAPDSPGMGRLPVRTTIFPYSCENDAWSGIKDRHRGDWVKALNGKWDFQYFASPAAIPADFSGTVSDSSESTQINVPGCWDMLGYDRPHYTNTQMPWPQMPPEVPDENPTGLYSRSFYIDDVWVKRRTVLHFDGVESCFAVWVNGDFAGYSKDSRGATEFDITAMISQGKNQLVVLVHKWSDGCFIEDQDQWWHAGIVRSVYLYSTSLCHIADIGVTSVLGDNFSSGHLCLEMIAGFPNYFDYGKWMFRIRLYDMDHMLLWEKCTVVGHPPVTQDYPGDYTRAWSKVEADVGVIKAWSAEKPALYILTVALVGPDGQECEVSGCRIGFRSIKIANRKLLINGKAVLINGVNRHEHDQYHGRTVSEDLTRRDIILMKQFNINAIRTSHYPNMPEFYDLCDEYGIYVFDEANVENNAFTKDICHNPNWAGAYLDRAIRMVGRDRNHPSVLAWSLGNESGCGANHYAMNGWIRAFDPSRPIFYVEGSTDPALADIVGFMYSGIDDLIKWSLTPESKTFSSDQRPWILSEYSHSMGNSNGGLKKYYDAFEHYSGLQGGFIWEWCDHGIVKIDQQGCEYWAYGGDFGDEPNDTNFVADGLVWPDRTPHAALYELKKLAQPLTVTAIDLLAGRLRLTNRRYFCDLGDLVMNWDLTVDGTIIQHGSYDGLVVPPIPFDGDGINPVANCIECILPLERPSLRPHQTCMLTLRFVLKGSSSWANAGHEVAWEQFIMPYGSLCDGSSTALPVELDILTECGSLKLSAGELRMNFGSAEGDTSLMAAEETLVKSMRLNIMRAPTDNDGIKNQLHFKDESDFRNQKGKILVNWLERGIFNIKCEQRKFERNADLGIWSFSRYVTPQGYGIDWSQKIQITTPTSLIMENTFTIDRNLADLPRLGILMELPVDFENVTWFGRGPQENHIDRCAGYPFGLYTRSIEQMHEPYIMPQENGNRCGVKWLRLTGGKIDHALKISAPEQMEFSISRYSAQQMFRAKHNRELVPEDCIYLKLDYRQRGVGTASCGPDTLAQYRLSSGVFHFVLKLDSERK